MKLIQSLLSLFTNNKEQTQENENITSLNTNNTAESSIQYIQDGNVLYHTDGTDIEDSEVPYLIQTGLSQRLEEIKTSPNPKWHRTDEEKKLKHKFSLKNYDYLQEKEHEITNFIQQARKPITDVDTTIADCQKAIQFFYVLKDFCYQTKGGELYFQDMWEHCHNSQNPDFSFIEKVELRLKDLTENYDERKKHYKKHQYIERYLKEDLLQFITNHQNILQKDVYSHFDKSLKDNISKMLYDMDKAGEIKRVKQGSTYQLSIIENKTP